MSSVLEWKEEPVSPLSNYSYEEAALLDDDAFYQTTLDAKFDADLLSCESKAEVASQILENLENLMDLDELIKDEPFLLDEKMLPMLDDVIEPTPCAVAVPVHNFKMEDVKHHQTTSVQYLLNDFDNFYGTVTHLPEGAMVIHPPQGTLTPPQSPPSKSPPTLTTLEPIMAAYSMPEHKTIYSIPEKTVSYNTNHVPDVVKQPLSTLDYRSNIPEYPPNTPQPDIARELAVVDELVRTRVEDMQWSSGPSSPDSNSSSSNSNFGDCSSDDPEWQPETLEKYTNEDENCDAVAKTPKKRSKPYSRSNIQDKKSRKKEQNKNAATRYRLKKKAEVEVILTEEKQLLEANGKVMDKITDLEREIKYLKGLMRDLFKAKGIIN